jgi:poly(A) polymerase
MTKEEQCKEAEALLMQLMADMPASHSLKGKAYIAGGAVRDEVMGLQPKDIDITVEVEGGGIRFAEYISALMNLREPVIFPTFGTAKIELANGMEIEFIATRSERYEKGSRKPIISFGTLAQDVERRDFTVNSLVKSLSTGEILDLTGMGIEDIEKGIIRTSLDPDVIFDEDALRMLRAVRFSVRFGWPIADNVRESIKRNVENLDTISKERIRDEINTIIRDSKLHKAIPLMDELGLLEKIFPEMKDCQGVVQGPKHHSEGDVYVHTLLVIKTLEEANPGADAPTVLSALMHDWGKPSTQEISSPDHMSFHKHENVSGKLAEERMRDLKYSEDELSKTKVLVENHMRGHRAFEWKKSAFRKFRRDLGDHYEDELRLLLADSLSSIPYDKEPSRKNHDLIIEKMPEMTEIPVHVQLPINGHDIMERYEVEGREVGRLKKILEDLVDENPELALGSKEECFAAIEKAELGEE